MVTGSLSLLQTKYIWSAIHIMHTLVSIDTYRMRDAEAPHSCYARAQHCAETYADV
jgi:hypothetical protein